MDIPGLGKVEKDDAIDEWYKSVPIVIPALGNDMRRIIVDGYEDDPNKEDFHVAISNFLRISSSVLADAAPHVFAYYECCRSAWGLDDPNFVKIDSAANVFCHVRLGPDPIVQRRKSNKEIYVSLECECDWEPEHGLQIVFRNGLNVNKVGPYDGHLTNSDAFRNAELEDVIYQEF